MKKNFGVVFGLPCWGMGAAVLALFAFTSASRATVIVNNLADATVSSAETGWYYGQVFTMGSSSSGNLGTLTLDLYSGSTGSAVVYLYNASGGAPTGSGVAIGTVSGTGNQTIALGSHPALAASTSYAIIIHDNVSSDVRWNYTANAASGGTGSLPGGIVFSSDGSSGWGSTANEYMQMEVDVVPVPEVPMTGMFMGIGALAIAAGRTLRRRLCAARSA